ncbi:AAA family ATPase [Limibacter armeniacum]|uniref:ATP-binding protein n=1 Tax=Limibacter armeniacum TaxID=466084 RepID=UPI002FE65B3F
MQKLRNQLVNLLRHTDTRFVRYLYQEVDWSSRMIAIVGARGVGKTTMLLQRIKMEHKLDEALYAKADDLYFSENGLLELATDFEAKGGKYLYLDEIHKYENWSQELKDIYDYLPNLKVVFTGSSILDIYKGYADLSRRVIPYHMFGLSFREYLTLKEVAQLPVIPLQEVLEHQYTEKVLLNTSLKPLAHFETYLKEGYYPFFSEGNYDIRLRGVVTTMLEVDIPQFANLPASTAAKLKRLLHVISRSVPFKPNQTKLAEAIGASRPALADYMAFLEKADLTKGLSYPPEGIGALRKLEKLFLQNTNLMYALADGLPDIGNIRETFFFSQLNVKHQVEASKAADFLVDHQLTFEIGGKSKKTKQISGIDNAYVVKDNIEAGEGNILPLWAFGLLY